MPHLTLDLFSGIGGFALGLERSGNFKTIAFFECDKFCQSILKKHWPDEPCAADIRALTYKDEVLSYAGEPIYRGRIDAICGGFPCQPYSVAGKQRGFEDSRDLWPEMFRLIAEIKPLIIIGENVAGFIRMGLARTSHDLAHAGYAMQAYIIPACAVGAPHLRNRVWIIAHAKHNGSSAAAQSGGAASANERATQGAQKACEPARPIDLRATLSNTNSVRCEGNGKKPLSGLASVSWQFSGSHSSNPGRWDLSEPMVCGVGDGVPARVDRTRALGNAVVPQVVEMIGRAFPCA